MADALEAQAAAQVTASRAADGGWTSGAAYSAYFVAVLTLISTVSYIDRTMLNILIDPVKRSLLLTDTQISLVQGLGFTVAYVAASPFFGWMTDRTNRRLLLLAMALLWSFATALSALATGFWTLLLCRAMVGAAEACVQPACWSLLSDRFPAERLPRVMSLFLIAPYLGGGLALIFGGALIGSTAAVGQAIPALAAIDPWRQVYVLVGISGAALAMFLLAVREPPRGARDGVGSDAEKAPGIGETLGFLWRERGFFGWFFLAMGSLVVILYSAPAWIPIAVSRIHGTPLATVGLRFGTMTLIAGTIGVLTGPLVVQMLARRGVEGSLAVAIRIIAVALIPCAAILPFTWSPGSALVSAAVLTFLYSLPQSMGTSALQIVTPPRMRGVSTGIYVIVVSVTGLGLGPLAVALLTDQLFGDPKMVGWSLGIVCTVSAVVAAMAASRMIGPYRALTAERG